MASGEVHFEGVISTSGIQ